MGKGPRFSHGPGETLEPGPSAYKSVEAYKFTDSHRGKMKMPMAKRTSFVDVAAMKSLSPGPARHATSIAKLGLLSMSPSRKRL